LIKHGFLSKLEMGAPGTVVFGGRNSFRGEAPTGAMAAMGDMSYLGPLPGYLPFWTFGTSVTIKPSPENEVKNLIGMGALGTI
jgi:hypothetical protein